MLRVNRWFAARLERGNLLPASVAAPLSAPYAFVTNRTLARPASLPPGTPIIGIGGAVLGGAGKTPVAIAYAQALADLGWRVALVSHGYRALTSSPRIVSVLDPVRSVGDDALVAARALQHSGVTVWVGQQRDDALQAAARNADVVIVDGLLQTRPQRLARSVLVLDATKPFGAAACPPAGDLRGPVHKVIELCDEVVLVIDARQSFPPDVPPEIACARPRPLIRIARVEMAGASSRNHHLPLESLSALRVGVLTLIAHPERVDASLRLRGIRPACAWHGADHGSLDGSDLRTVRALARNHALDAWVVTPKCVTHMVGADLGCRLFVLEVTTRLDPSPPPVVDSPPCVPEDS